MSKTSILNYFKSKIPDYSIASNAEKHLFQFDLYVYPFLFKGNQTFFINQLCEVLAFIDLYVANYSKKVIDGLATIPKNKPEQIFQDIAEVFVLYNLLNIDGAERNSVEIEPAAQPDGKNPEYRIKINKKWYAVEVKTPDAATLINRQNGVQITARMTDEELELLRNHRKITFTKDLKVKDYLKSAEEKFSQYSAHSDYQDDIKILIIVWDDFINEVISALIHPKSGLLTANSFSDLGALSHIDGVIVFRHLHILRRLFYFGEFEEGKNAFDIDNYLPGVIFYTPQGKGIPWFDFKDYAAPMEENETGIAEYNPTDFVDWAISTGIYGLHHLSPEYRKRILEYVSKNKITNAIYSNDYLNFNLINLSRTLEHYQDEEKVFKEFLRMWKHSCKFDMADIKKSEISINDYQKANMALKMRFENYKNIDITKLCPCRQSSKFLSFKAYGDCCRNKIAHYSWGTFYER